MTIAAVAMVVLNSDGAEATQAELDDGVVWVTNQELGVVGRLNVEIDEIDTAVLGASLGLDVLQEERDVVIAGEAGGVQRVDVLTGGASGANAVPLGNYQMAGGVGVVYDEATGRLWTGPSTRVVGGTYPDNPDALLEPGTKVLVTSATTQSRIPAIHDDADTLPMRGRVLSLTSEGWQEIPLGPDFLPLAATVDADFVPPTTLLPPETAPDAPTTTVPPAPVFELPTVRAGVAPSEAVELSAVGGIPVVLNDEAQVVVAEDRAVSVESTTVRLQQVGHPADSVFVATDRALVRIGLDDGSGTDVVAKASGSEVLGVPSQPVRVGRCVYGAWSAAESVYARWCDGDDLVEPLAVPGAAPDAELVWRVNQRNVVLNSPGNGDAWADHDGALAYVGNWSDVDPDESVIELSDSVGDSQSFVERRCSDDGESVPIASDDEVAVRGRQSMLELLINDDDLDCEPFRIDSLTPTSGDFGALTVVDSGQRVLWTPNEEFVDSGANGFDFDYDLVDAAGHRSEPATVSVAIVDEKANRAPQLIEVTKSRSRVMASVVEEGQAIKYDVLEDWEDPEGDPLEVTGVDVVGGGEVSVDRDDVLTFAAYGASPGVSRVTVTVSDGREATTRDWAVTISPRGTELQPEANDDFVTVAVGATATVDPLENDSDGNDDTLSLQPTWGGTEGISAFIANDEVSITPSAPGLYRLDYMANDGSASGGSPASILVTALDPTGANNAPVAVPDEVEIRPGRVVDIDVLGNDIDVDGDVLSVVDVIAPEGIRASISDRHLVQVEIPAGTTGAGSDADLPDEFLVSYRIVDGREGERDAPQGDGGINISGGTVNIGDNVAINGDVNIEGDVNISDGATIGDDVIINGVRNGDRTELRSSGVLTVRAIPPDEDADPVAEPDRLVVRSGQVGAVKVVDNDGDPDADEVVVDDVDRDRVLELEEAGQAVIWFDESHVFAYGAEPGEYTLAYHVKANGRSASSEVTIEVVPPADAAHPNQEPELPHRLVRAVRGGTVRVQLPLAGSDPDGDPVSLGGAIGATEAGVNTVQVDPNDPGVVLFSADPLSPDTDRFTYSVRDRLGAGAIGTMDVVIIDDGGWSPQGHDDVVVAQPGRRIVVDALSNDTSPQDNVLSFVSPPFFDVEGRPSRTPLNDGAVELLDQADPDRQGLVMVDVPTGRSTLVERYALTDGVSDSNALIRVTPDPDAVNLGPRVADDVVILDDLPQSSVGDEVAVDVTANDFDLDNADRDDALTVEVPAFQDASVRGDQVVVTLADDAQSIVYRAIDSDGASAVGVIEVPGASANRAPVLSPEGTDEGRRIVRADTNDPIEVRLADVVSDPDGDTVAFTDRAPRLVSGEATLTSDDGGFTITPGPNRASTSVASVEIEVTDRPGLSADERSLPGCNCVSTLVVRSVIEANNEIRVLRPGAAQIPQLGEPISVDLEPLAEFDGEQPLTYELGSVPSGFDIAVDGASLQITSTESHPIGERFEVSYNMSAGDAKPVTNIVTLTVSKTNRPEPVVGELGPFDAVRGEVLDLPNIVDAAFSPFPDDPLVVRSASASGGTVSCTPSGECTFQSGTDVGAMTVTYTIEDAVGRTAAGSFVVNVKGAPLAPSPPAVESVGDQQVTLSWSPPDLQGGSLQRYQVMVVETGAISEVGSTGGTITGLENNVVYTFIVRAVNDVGEGEWSPPSSGAVPDRPPDPLTGARFVDYGDGTLMLAWNPPSTADQYSAVRAYQVRLSPGGQVLTIDDPNTTEIAVGTGGIGQPLPNGQRHTFAVRARNSADQNNGWGEWSDQSGAETPSRSPDPPNGVKAFNSGSADAPSLTATWDPPDFDGGRDLVRYEACATSTSGQRMCREVNVEAGNQAVFGGLSPDTQWTVSVRAYNTDKHDDESTEAASPEVSVIGNPDPPSFSSVASSSRTVTASASPGGGSGCDEAYVEYSLDDRTWGANGRFVNLTNGVVYAVYARTRLSSSCGTDGVTYVSTSVRSRSVLPLGALPVLQLSQRQDAGTLNGWTLTIDRGDDGYGDSLRLEANSSCTAFADKQVPPENSSATYTVDAGSGGQLADGETLGPCEVTVVAPRFAMSLDGLWETAIGSAFQRQAENP